MASADVWIRLAGGEELWTADAGLEWGWGDWGLVLPARLVEAEGEQTL